MLCYSTNHQCPPVSLCDAVRAGLAPDGGLYMPKQFPVLPSSFWQATKQLTFLEVAHTMAQHLFGDEIVPEDLNKIINNACTFDAPLVALGDGTFILELFHGPTLAFKDFAAQFLGQLMAYLQKGSDRELTILVATSGDTGSAVARGFFGVPGIQVIILYPSSMVSLVQEKQLTTMGGNITALEVAGTFDDCQRLVKTAFLDEDIKKKRLLGSANSISIGRLLPQSFYYAHAYRQVAGQQRPVIFSVPSGNFGNVTAGVIAKKMGMPARFVAATNINDVVPEYLATGIFTPRPSQRTISNAMDVGNPSNFVRLLELCDNDVQKMRSDITSYSYSDDATRQAIRDVHTRHNYILDPHGAVAYLGLEQFKKDIPGAITGIVLETAHPAKFAEVVEQEIDEKIILPPALAECLPKEKKAIPMPADFVVFKEWLVA